MAEELCSVALAACGKSFPIDNFQGHVSQWKMLVGYPDQCRACQTSHLGPNEIGPIANEKISSKVPEGFPSTSMDKVQLGTRDRRGLAQQEEVCVRLSDTLMSS